MTDLEFNARRMATWDKYVAARGKLVAFKSKIMEWGAEFGKASSVCSSKPLQVHEDKLAALALPTREDIAKTCVDMRQAVTDYRLYRGQASDFGFLVGADDETNGNGSDFGFAPPRPIMQ
jgi:hypothetical protein